HPVAYAGPLDGVAVQSLCFVLGKGHIKGDAHLIGNQEPAGFQCSIPSKAKCFARDVGLGLKTGTCGTKWVYGLTTKFAIENDLLSGATDSQIAFEFELFTIEIDDFQRFEV